MLDKVKRTIKKHNMISNGDSIVVGFSGGPDSLCLLHILLKLREEYNLSICAAHINHLIRGEEAKRDEDFARKFCETNNIKFFLKREDVNSLAKKMKMSSEEAGRKVRYEFFNEVSSKVSGNKIALAHNLNDNGETIIMRILRGTSLSGLSGIAPKRDTIIRPLIDCSRKEIENYCTENNLNPVIDSTNLEEVYTRNKIRLNIIPYIENNFNKNILKNLHYNSNIVRDEENLINFYSEKEVLNITVENGYNIERFNNLHIAMKRRVLRNIIKEKIGNLNGIEYKHIESIINFLKSPKSGKKIDIKKGLVLTIDYDVFNISLNTESKILKDIRHNILEGEIIINDYKIKANIISKDEYKKDSNSICFDFDKIKEEVLVRYRENGDYIYPKGLKGRKKIKDLFIDMKIPRDVRNSIPIIAVGKEVLIIPNIKITSSYSIDNNTNNILKVEIKGV